MQAELKYVPLDSLVASVDNVRRHHDPAKHAELVASIREHGILTPLVVRPSLREGEYEVAAGHRRLRAATELGLAELAVSVRSMGDRTFREVMLTENLQRVDPDPLDEADAYQSMIDELGYDVATLAAKFGKGETYVRARLVLTRLAPSVRTALEAGRIELGHAVLLARVSEDAQELLLQDELLAPFKMHRRVTREDFDDGETVETELTSRSEQDAAIAAGAALVFSLERTRVTVGELRLLMAETLLPLNCVKWDRDDLALVVTAGSCTACPKRTGANPMLFEELNAGDDRCSDASCYEAKTLAWLSQRADAVRSQAPAVVLITTKRQRKLKALDRAPVLRVEHDYTTARPGYRGSVPALVVESGAYSTADRWAELGELRDVKRVKKAPAAPKPAAGAATSGASDARYSRESIERADALYCAGVSAMAVAMRHATGPLPPADRLIAAWLLNDFDLSTHGDLRAALATALQSPRVTRAQWKAPLLVEMADVLAWETRAAHVALSILTCEAADIPEDPTSISDEWGTYPLPDALHVLAMTAGVPQPLAVWSEALERAQGAAVDEPAAETAGLA